MDLLAVVVRHERRIRIVFSSAVAAGAFSPAAYSVTALEGASAIPVVGAMLVGSASTNVELALGADLVDGVLYAVGARGVPALDGSVLASASLSFRRFGDAHVSNLERPASDLPALLYGVDLVWTGTDFGETPLGDLDTVTGAENARGALERRFAAEEDLPWRAGRYGIGARDFIDGPTRDAATLRGAILRQAATDNRVKSTAVALSIDNEKGDAFFDVTVSLIGADDLALKVAVPKA
jgi:hypothetical protein